MDAGGRRDGEHVAREGRKKWPTDSSMPKDAVRLADSVWLNDRSSYVAAPMYRSI